MHRSIIPILLYIGAATTAPPETDIANIKSNTASGQSPTIETLADSPRLLNQNLPLTVPDYINSGEEGVTTTEEDYSEEITETTPARITIQPKKATPSPRFYSKLNYFKDGFSTNLIDAGPVKKGFKSKCRCERIWNCPKLQITVPRCPNEYFMCCF